MKTPIFSVSYFPGLTKNKQNRIPSILPSIPTGNPPAFCYRIFLLNGAGRSQSIPEILPALPFRRIQCRRHLTPFFLANVLLFSLSQKEGVSDKQSDTPSFFRVPPLTYIGQKPRHLFRYSVIELYNHLFPVSRKHSPHTEFYHIVESIIDRLMLPRF